MTAIKKNTISRAKKEEPSRLSAFLERPLPDAEEVSRFEEAVKKEVRTEEMDDNLSAIYHDGKGNLVDVTTVKKKKRLRILVLFKKIFVLTIIVCGLYGIYSYYFQHSVGTDEIDLQISAPEKVIAGESFSYELKYRNNSKQALSGVKLEAILPVGFVLTGSSPAATGINSWPLDNLSPNASGTITINGYLIAAVDSANVITAKLSYTPANFSSEFKKESSANTVISGLGFNVAADYLNTALVGQSNELKLVLSDFQNNQLSDFYLEIVSADNLKIKSVGTGSGKTAAGTASSTSANTASSTAINQIQAAGEGRWSISSVPASSTESLSLPIVFNLSAKNKDREDLTLRLLKKETDGSERIFWEKTISLEIMKSDLNLSLSLNNEKSDQPVNFGSTLNYSLSYSNNGDSSLYDLVLMAVVKGDFIQWPSLHDPSGGSVSGNAIVWTKEQVPALSELAPGAAGKIDFSLKVKDFSESDLAKDFTITSYAQYSLNGKAKQAENDDNKSNTIKSQINSDFSLNEKILYFNEDNIPVGSGPLPPRVNEKTSVRVFWTVKNNLHDLENTQVALNLPQGVDWAGSDNTNVGRVTYDQTSRRVTWNLGILPLSIYRADAEFNISLTPTEADRNKILVLSPGGVATAGDTLTKAELTSQASPKTTKLEDDEIAGLSNNGRVE